MRLKLFFLLFIFLFSFSRKSFSQAENTDDVFLFDRITFTSPSYVTISEGFGNLEPLVSEVNFSPDNLFLFGVKKRFGFEFSPRIVFRSYSRSSFPISTPSFILRESLFYKVENSLTHNILFPYISLGHHSNGQDGNAVNSDSSINHLTGSFANNYAEAGIMLLTQNIKPFNPFSTVRFFASYNHIDPVTIRNLYGKYRFSAEFESILFIDSSEKLKENTAKYGKSKITGLLHIELIEGPIIENESLFSKRIIANYSLFYQPAFFGPFSIFTRFYWGQDYYNINFDRSLSVIQFGIAMKNLKLWY